MAELPTVKIKADTKLGYMVINQDDFDPRKHQPYEKTVGGKAKAKLPAELDSLSNKELAAWGRKALGLQKLNGRMSRASIMKIIKTGIAGQRDG